MNLSIDLVYFITHDNKFPIKYCYVEGNKTLSDFSVPQESVIDSNIEIEPICSFQLGHFETQKFSF